MIGFEYYNPAKIVFGEESEKSLKGLLEKHNVRFIWVKGHASNEENNRCDQLAVRERENYAAQNH